MSHSHPPPLSSLPEGLRTPTDKGEAIMKERRQLAAVHRGVLLRILGSLTRPEERRVVGGWTNERVSRATLGLHRRARESRSQAQGECPAPNHAAARRVCARLSQCAVGRGS